MEREWASFLREGGWTLSTAEGQSTVELERENNGFHMRVRFNVQEVVAASYEDDGPYDADEDGAEAAGGAGEAEGEGDEDWTPNGAPFSMDVEIARVRQEKHKLVLQCNASVNDSGADYLAIDSLFLETAGSAEKMAYTGPEFGTLDEDLQRQFEAFLGSQVDSGRLIEFVRAYSEAKENVEYEAWLGRVKSLVA